MDRAWSSWVLGSMVSLMAAGCAGDNDRNNNGAVPLPFCAPGQTQQCSCADGSDPAQGCAPVPGMMAPTGPVGGAAGTPSAVDMAGSQGSAAGVGGSGGSSGSSGSAGGDSGTGGSAGAGGAAGSAGSAPMVGSGEAGSSGSGGSGEAGSSGSGGTMAGSGGDAGSGDPMAATGCGEGGWTGKASNAGAAGAGRGSGSIGLTLPVGNRFTRLQTTLEVPAKPPGSSGTVFLWPGLEPLRGDANYNPIGLGVLQPVLTWGPSCAAQAPRDTHEEWWIAGMYVNVSGSSPEHRGCIDGDVMQVQVEDLLEIDMALEDTTWTQTITAQMGMTTVDFAIDLEGQPQRWALFEIELPGSAKPTEDVVFTDTVLTFAEPDEERCQPLSRGQNDYFSTPTASADGLRCCFSRIVLRAAGVTATTTDPKP